MAARTNYLLALRDLMFTRPASIELPVYLCDSILPPEVHAGLSQRLGSSMELRTTAGRLLVPAEVTTDRETIGRYADALEFCVQTGSYSSNEFLAYCRGRGIPTEEEELHTRLFRRLRRLTAENRNGIWARIIKNAFAPYFVGKVDFVAGNPPLDQLGKPAGGLSARTATSLESLWPFHIGSKRGPARGRQKRPRYAVYI
jgi:hypothetical protein